MLANEYINDPFDFSYNFDYDMLNTFNGINSYEISDDNVSAISYKISKCVTVQETAEETGKSDSMHESNVLTFTSEIEEVKEIPQIQKRIKTGLKKKYKNQNNTLTMKKFLEFKNKNNVTNWYHIDLERSLKTNFDSLVRICKKIRKQQKRGCFDRK